MRTNKMFINLLTYLNFCYKLLIILCCLSLQSFSQTNYQLWFVDINSGGNNSGTSWENAWASLENIDWTLIHAGDTVYISGGADSLVYENQTLRIRTSGTFLDPIIITKGKSVGYNGKVIITNGSYTESISAVNEDNWVVSHLSLRPNIGQGVSVDRCENVILEYLDITNIVAGIAAQECIDLTIRYCNIVSVNYYQDQTDGIYSQKNRRIKIYNNLIEIRNTNPNGHNDCIQSFEDGVDASNSNEETMMVYNNILYQNNPKTYNASVTMFANGFGWFTFYNNLVLQPYSKNTGLGGQQGAADAKMKFRIWNNTLIGRNLGKPIYFRYLEMGDTVEVVNNLIYNTYPYHKIRVNDSPNFTSPAIVKRWDYNSYFSPVSAWTRIAQINTTNYDLTSWRGLGFDLHGLISNPLLINPIIGIDSIGNYYLQPGSPAANAGFNLQEEVEALGMEWKDLNGYPRDNSPDIGAFDSDQSFGDLTPPEVLSASLVDSVTLAITFSEPLNESSAENINNYLINNGISINSATLNGEVVSLNTSEHTPGQYLLTVSNVTDTAGNVISPEHNSATYVYNPDPNNGLIKFVPVNTFASSIPEPNHTPEKTLDGKGFFQGDPDSRWAGTNLPQWIAYDFGDTIMLSKTRISFYKWNEERIYNYSIQVSIDSIIWSEVKTNIQSNNLEWSEEIFESAPARYVKFIVLSSNQSDWASLWEAELWGQFIISNVDDELTKPTEFVLEQNYPNPFNPSTKIVVRLPQSTQMRLAVYNLLGELINEIANSEYTAGMHEFNFEATGLSSGIYIYRFESPYFVKAKKMILLR